MRRLLAPLAVVLLLAVVGLALGVEVKLPPRARAKVALIVDELGDAIFGAKPGRVEVTNFPTGGGTLLTLAQDLPLAPGASTELVADVSAYSVVSLLATTGNVASAGFLTFNFLAAAGNLSDPTIAKGTQHQCILTSAGMFSCAAGGDPSRPLGLPVGGTHLGVSVMNNAQSQQAAAVTVKVWAR